MCVMFTVEYMYMVPIIVCVVFIKSWSVYIYIDFIASTRCTCIENHMKDWNCFSTIKSGDVWRVKILISTELGKSNYLVIDCTYLLYKLLFLQAQQSESQINAKLIFVIVVTWFWWNDIFTTVHICCRPRWLSWFCMFRFHVTTIF